jgi:broad specificity phosphatase PhoE
MKPDRIIIIRHGQSIGNINKDVHETIPDPDLELTSLGRDQAEQAGKLINLFAGRSSVIYTSSFNRAKHTAAILSNNIDCVPEIREDCRLREHEWGNFRAESKTKEYMEQSNSFGRYYYRYPEGESCADVFVRMKSFIDDLNKDFSCHYFPRNCIISTHGIAARVFLKAWFRFTVQEFYELDYVQNCEGFIIDLNSNKCSWEKYDFSKNIENLEHID